MAKIVSIHSFRGGTGKSNMTANLSSLVALGGKRVAVVGTGASAIQFVPPVAAEAAARPSRGRRRRLGQPCTRGSGH